MTAIATTALKKKFIDLLFNEITTDDSSEYYIGIGKSDQYNSTDTVIAPLQTEREQRVARGNIQSVKKVSFTSYVIPRYNWTSGAFYNGYSDSTVGIPTNSYYVLTENNEVYICLQQGKNNVGVPTTSTIQPNYSTAGVSQNQAFETSDGYRWKFLYALSATRASNFLSAGHIPVEKVIWNEAGDSASLNTFELQQLDIQQSAVPGQILGAVITNGGMGYTSAPTVTFEGNGSSAAATATVVGGSIVKIEMNNESAAMGNGYDYASIKITGGGGSGAQARPVLSPKFGIGADPREELKSNSLMLVSKLQGDEGGDFITDNDFRQISVMKNLKLRDSDALFTDNTGRVLNQLNMTATAEGVFTNDKFIRGALSGAGAFIDNIDSSVIYYHQNETTGFGTFVDGELLEESDGGGTGTIDSAAVNSIVDAYTGDVFYIENRSRIIRDPAQTEDIKVIITV